MAHQLDTEPLRGSSDDPEFRRRRAQKAGRAGARRRLSLAYHVEQVVARAPALTDEQVQRLRALLPEARDEAGEG